MTVPSQMWIPLGVITAALIAGFISLVNLMIAKDQKITEFRQAWIDSLRNEIATFISLSSTFSSLRHVVDMKQDQPATRKEAVDDILALLKDENARRSECRNKILLLLNPGDDRALLSKVEDLHRAGSIASREAHADVIRKCDELLSETQKLLKKEWKRVKRGEPFYVVVKIATIIAVLILILVAAVGTRQYW